MQVLVFKVFSYILYYNFIVFNEFNRVWDLKIPGYSYGGAISEWISKFLEKPNLDLVNFGNNFDADTRSVKLVDPACAAKDDASIIYSDASSFMLLSENSLNDLNSRLNAPVSIVNFRPNFFAKDCDKPYAEV